MQQDTVLSMQHFLPTPSVYTALTEEEAVLLYSGPFCQVKERDTLKIQLLLFIGHQSCLFKGRWSTGRK